MPGFVFWWIGIFRNEAFSFVSRRFPLSALVAVPFRAGQPDLAERLKVDCNRIWRAAVLAKKCAHNIVADLPVVKVPKSKHRPAILIPRRYGDLLRAIDGYTYQTEVSTRYLLKILPHLALRSAEIRWARWSMIDFDAAELRLPP